MNDVIYPNDGKLRPVEYGPEVHKVVLETCNNIKNKHRAFIENADIDFENFVSECAERVWKGLTYQFKGGSSVKTYVYIICGNHWRNTVHKFFVKVKNYENFTTNVLTSQCAKMVNIEVTKNREDEDKQLIPIAQLHSEYDEEIDYDRILLIIRKFIRFTYSIHGKNKKMARAVIKVFDGEPITRVAKKYGVSLKSLNSEVAKFGTVYKFNDETFEFEVV